MQRERDQLKAQAVHPPLDRQQPLGQPWQKHRTGEQAHARPGVAGTQHGRAQCEHTSPALRVHVAALHGGRSSLGELGRLSNALLPGAPPAPHGLHRDRCRLCKLALGFVELPAGLGRGLTGGLEHRDLVAAAVLAVAMAARVVALVANLKHRARAPAPRGRSGELLGNAREGSRHGRLPRGAFRAQVRQLARLALERSHSGLSGMAPWQRARKGERALELRRQVVAEGGLARERLQRLLRGGEHACALLGDRLLRAAQPLAQRNCRHVHGKILDRRRPLRNKFDRDVGSLHDDNFATKRLFSMNFPE